MIMPSDDGIQSLIEEVIYNTNNRYKEYRLMFLHH